MILTGTVNLSTDHDLNVLVTHVMVLEAQVFFSNSLLILNVEGCIAAAFLIG